MDEYLKPWILKTFESFEEAINAEEASGAQFLGNAIAVLEGAPTNLTRFRKLAPGETPSGVVHVASLSHPGTQNCNPVWSGAVLVGAASTALCVFR